MMIIKIMILYFIQIRHTDDFSELNWSSFNLKCIVLNIPAEPSCFGGFSVFLISSAVGYLIFPAPPNTSYLDLFNINRSTMISLFQ